MRSSLFFLCLLLIPPALAQPPRARAWKALESKGLEQKYLDHLRAVEAIMQEMAAPEDREEWGLTGLLHDIDIGTTAGKPAHGVDGARMVRELGFSEAVAHAIESHDDSAGVARTGRLDHALYCADQVYWLIQAAGGASATWERIQTVPSKKPILGAVAQECGAVGFTMPRAVDAAQSAMRKLPKEEK